VIVNGKKDCRCYMVCENIKFDRLCYYDQRGLYKAFFHSNIPKIHNVILYDVTDLLLTPHISTFNLLTNFKRIFALLLVLAEFNCEMLLSRFQFLKYQCGKGTYCILFLNCLIPICLIALFLALAHCKSMAKRKAL